MNKRIKKKLARRYGKFHYSSDLDVKNKRYEEALERFKSVYEGYIPYVNLGNVIYEDGIIKGFVHIDLAQMPDMSYPMEFAVNTDEKS